MVLSEVRRRVATTPAVRVPEHRSSSPLAGAPRLAAADPPGGEPWAEGEEGDEGRAENRARCDQVPHENRLIRSRRRLTEQLVPRRAPSRHKHRRAYERVPGHDGGVGCSDRERALAVARRVETHLRLSAGDGSGRLPVLRQHPRRPSVPRELAQGLLGRSLTPAFVIILIFPFSLQLLVGERAWRRGSGHP